MKEIKYKVYSLADPLTGLVRYIGMSGTSLDKRIKNHVLARKDKNKKQHWINGLVKLGLLPIGDIIEDDLTYEQAIEYEKGYIKLYLSAGANLVNGTMGGEGFVYGIMSKEIRKKIADSQRGKKRPPTTEENRRKISIAVSNNLPSTAFKKGQSPYNKGTKGVVKAWNKGLKTGPMVTRGIKRSEETKAKQRAAWVIRKQKAAEKEQSKAA